MNPRGTHAGLELVYLASDQTHRSLFFSKVPQALDLIAKRDPRRFKRITELLSRIALVPDGGEYVHAGVATYFMDIPTLTVRPVEELAMKVVHEMTHLRLRRCGIATTSANQERIEHLCVGEEISFAERLPDAGALIARARAKLDTPWWTPEQMQQRYRKQLKSFGLPAWLVRIMERRSR